MPQLMQAFNARNFDPTQSGGQLPVGEHVVIVKSSDVKGAKSGAGGYVQFDLEIIEEGPNKGATGAYRLNVYHDKQEVVEIALRQLSALCHVMGVLDIQDTAQLHNIPFRVVVGPQKNDPKYTEVKSVKDANGNAPGAGGGQPQGQAPAQDQGAWGAAQGQGQAPQGQGQQPPQGQTPAWGGGQQQAQAPAQDQGQAPAWGQGQGQQANDQGQQQAAWGQQQGQGQAQAPQGQAQAPAWGGGQQAAPWGKTN